MTTSTVLDYAARLDNGVRTYGQGDAAIHALDGANAEFERGEVHRHHGTFRIGEVDPAVLHCGTRQPHARKSRYR